MNMYRRRSVFEFRDHLTRHEMIEVETLLRRVGSGHRRDFVYEHDGPPDRSFDAS